MAQDESPEFKSQSCKMTTKQPKMGDQGSPSWASSSGLDLSQEVACHASMGHRLWPNPGLVLGWCRLSTPKVDPQVPVLQPPQ
jgi:hypothetical protein